MKNQFNELKEKIQNKDFEKQIQMIDSFVDEIINTDSRLLSISKLWVNYGCWNAKVFANSYHFGKELTQIIEDCINGICTHDEDKEFDILDYRDKLIEALENHLIS